MGLLAACGSAPVEEGGGGDTEGSSGVSAASTGTSQATGSSSSGGAVDDVSTGSTSSTSGSSGGKLDGPGCGAPPPCDGGVFEGSILIESSADLALLEGFSAVSGFVEIVGTELECLDTLLCLEQVGRDLRIHDNTALRSTAGLSSLSVLGATAQQGGNIIIAQNPQLESLEGFALERVDGVLAVSRNEALYDIPGFASLRRLGSLSVQDNPVLESLAGLHALEQLSDCDVNHNEVLCISDVFAVCGDVLDEPGGVTDFNDDAC